MYESLEKALDELCNEIKTLEEVDHLRAFLHRIRESSMPKRPQPLSIRRICDLLENDRSRTIIWTDHQLRMALIKLWILHKGVGHPRGSELGAEAAKIDVDRLIDPFEM